MIADPAAPSLEALRAEFPIFAAVEPPFHYLDNAATGQICRAAADALLGFETRRRANVKRGVYRLADAATDAFETARQQVAAYLGAGTPEEVVITGGTTQGINMAALALQSRLRPGDEILLSALEHHSNIVPWQLVAERAGASLRALPITAEGRIDLDRLEDHLGERTRVVALAHASNVTGAVTDAPRVAEAAHAAGALFLLDGSQRAAHGPLDVQALGCDFYAISSHKMFGPTGAGALWVRPSVMADLPPALGGGEMIRRVTFEGTSYADPPDRFEPGTPPIGPAIGMGAAAAWLATLDWATLIERERALTGGMLEGLAALGGVRVVGPRSLDARIGVVAFDVEGVHPHDVCQLLDADHGISLRGGNHCAQPLMERLRVDATARASLALYNGPDDVAALLDGLETVIGRLR